MDDICLDCNDAIDEKPRNGQRWRQFKKDDIFLSTWQHMAAGVYGGRRTGQQQWRK
jgi:hypothetical protein